MMKRIMNIIYWVFIFAGGLHAQTYTINNDLQKINLAMFEADHLYMELDYNLYFDQEIQSQMKGIVKKQGRNLYQQVGDITVVKNEKYSVFIHGVKKMMVIDPNPVSNDPIKKEDILRINIDTLKSWLLGTELVEKDHSKMMMFTLKKGEYSRIMIEYDPGTYFIKRMELHARDAYTGADNSQHQVWMEVQFNQINSEMRFAQEDFSEKNFVAIKDKNNVVALGLYKKYNLINNLNKNIKYE